MRNVRRRAAVVVVAAALAGCTSTSGQKLSATRTPSATTGLAATAAPTGTATSAVGASPHSTGMPPSSPPPQPPSPRRMPLLTRQGLGGVPVGATVGKFNEVLGGPTPMSAADRSVFADHSCVIRQLARFPGVGLMVIGKDPAGPVRRISIVAGSDIRTDTGIGLGSSLRDVRAAYGSGLDEPFDHFPVGGDSVLAQAGANRYLAFIGDAQDRVVELRLGFKPEVLDPEGCV